MDQLASVFQKVWDDLKTQGQDALQTGDGAHLLRVEGGRAVLLHLAALLGYEVKVKEKENGKGPTKDSESRRQTKAEKTKGRRKSSLPPANL